jgi:hypothetical protein
LFVTDQVWVPKSCESFRTAPLASIERWFSLREVEKMLLVYGFDAVSCGH